MDTAHAIEHASCPCKTHKAGMPLECNQLLCLAKTFEPMAFRWQCAPLSMVPEIINFFKIGLNLVMGIAFILWEATAAQASQQLAHALMPCLTCSQPSSSGLPPNIEVKSFCGLNSQVT